VLAIGHLDPLKQFDDAIRAFAQSGLEDDGWSMATVGSGPSRPQLEDLVSALGLRRVQVHRPTKEIAAWYSRASLLLLPSKTESFSLVLAEAMLGGVVPVAYATDGPSFILQDFPAHLVPVGDVERMSEALVGFATADDTEALREELRRSIKERFSPEIIGAQWRALLS
jgi:glycosyltransferase involved in cell wall biosynthesis